MRDCELCKNFTLSPMSDVCRNCGIAMLNFEKRSLTNGDRIRAMSDEELAEWVWGAETAGRAYGPRGKKAWLDWLIREADE